MSESKFWLGWQPESGAPRHRHASLDAAQREAERLAECAPRRQFYVLEAVCVSKKVSVMTLPLINLDEELPF
ncbi:hypothetical protein ISN75_06655 [Dyella marensis]|uniref:hypothetical protein n=1 Tax=Dyella marensis TaxID=500610 RepID=UPI0031DC537D